jgi:hypothetical protein
MGVKLVFSCKWKEHRFWVFENRALTRISGIRGYKELHNEELHNSYSSPNRQIKDDQGE